ncbi:MAG: Snf7 family protein [Burkholderiales bacterium]|nr:Snf7 family protein [Burkholderiales bacterium]
MKLSLNRIFQILAVLTVVLSALVAGSAWQVQRFGRASDDATLRRYHSYLLAQELRQSSDYLTRLARTYVVTGDPKWEQQYWAVLDIRNGKAPRPIGYEGIYWDFKAANIEPPQKLGPAVPLDTLMKQAGFTPSEFALLDQARHNSDDLVHTETVAMNMVKGQYDDGKGGYTRKAPPDLAQARMMMHDLKYHQDKAKIMQPVQQFLEAVNRRTQGEVEAAQRQRALWSEVALVATLLLCTVLLAALAWARRSIFGVFGELRGAVAAVAAGDLTAKPVARYAQDEVGEAMRAVEAMRSSLESMIGQIRSSADSIATGSAQIATGNADLSRRTEEQASNLQQTAASMEEMNSTLRNSADTARTATKLANSASQAAVKGGSVVGEVVATMDEITASSKRISDIISVIDGIAFQTNILALNAAVEAARAGEQGRGFAVVASEVRSLAQRSAEAAREIKALIGASVDKVEAGARLVGAAGSSMDDIVTQVKRVADLIAEISTATTEQTTGIGQVSQAVTQLDHVTQQNAALVEESAAAADSLGQQAARLAEVVSQFRIGALA